jgi:hypothetical protein
MPSWTDLFGTIKDTFQVGLGVGQKTIKLGDRGSLSWNPSAVRTLTFPDKDGAIALTSDIPPFDGRVVSWGATKPAVPVDGQLWFEPLGFDVPWEWNSIASLWFAPVRHIILPVSSPLISSQASNRCDHPLILPDATYGIFIRNVQRIGSPGGTGSSASACWNANFGWWNGTSNALTQINSFTTAGYTTSGQVYRNNTVVNTNFANPFGVWCTFTKTGAPPATIMSLVIDYRISRT